MTKAPDKIFLAPLLVEGCGKTLSKRVTEKDAVYIREDLIVGLSEIPNDLEEAANVYSNCYSNPDGALARAARRAYITGAKWDREHMLKEAVECEVVDFSSSLEGHPHINIHLDNKQYRFGDKVRIIIIKEN